MSQIEVDEIEKIKRLCAWVRRLVGTIQPALIALGDRVADIEKQCNIWEFRVKYTEEDEIED